MTFYPCSHAVICLMKLYFPQLSMCVSNYRNVFAVSELSSTFNFTQPFLGLVQLGTEARAMRQVLACCCQSRRGGKLTQGACQFLSRRCLTFPIHGGCEVARCVCMSTRICDGKQRTGEDLPRRTERTPTRLTPHLK